MRPAEGHRVFARMVLVGVLAIGVAAADGPPGDLVVDDDNVQCAQATHSSIQAAVEAAAVGQTIRVCPGTYNETVTVDKERLTLRGVHYGDAGQRCQDPGAIPDPLQDSILNVPPNPDGGFIVEADGVTITGFVVRDNTMGPGISTSVDHSGYRADKNVIEDNAVGIELHSDGGARSVVTQNCLRRQMVPMMPGMGVGIHSHEGLANASIENNRFAANMSAAIDLSEEEDEDDGLLVTDVIVQRNESIGDGAFVRVADSQGTTITNNTVRGFGMTGGIVVEDDNVGVIVTNNTLRGGAGPGLRLDANDPMDDAAAPSTDVAFLRNTVEGAMSGVELAQGSAFGAVVQQNHITGSTGDGILMGTENSDNAVRQNHVRDNGEDGIHLESDTTENRIEQNSAFGNAAFDCRDDSGANTWEKNQGETSSPPGLCTPNGS